MQAFDQGSSMLALGLTAALTYAGTGDLRFTMRVLAIVACIATGSSQSSDGASSRALL